MKTMCPKCTQEYELLDDCIGMEGECEICRTIFTIKQYHNKVDQFYSILTNILKREEIEGSNLITEGQKKYIVDLGHEKYLPKYQDTATLILNYLINPMKSLLGIHYKVFSAEGNTNIPRKYKLPIYIALINSSIYSKLIEGVPVVKEEIDCLIKPILPERTYNMLKEDIPYKPYLSAYKYLFQFLNQKGYKNIEQEDLLEVTFELFGSELGFKLAHIQLEIEQHKIHSEYYTTNNDINLKLVEFINESLSTGRFSFRKPISFLSFL
ncbi:MAG: hypothetical protein WCR55_10960 [Lentisphaerota bacterium]